LLPAGAIAGWGLHPLESAAFARRTPLADMAFDFFVRHDSGTPAHLSSSSKTSMSFRYAPPPLT